MADKSPVGFLLTKVSGPGFDPIWEYELPAPLECLLGVSVEKLRVAMTCTSSIAFGFTLTVIVRMGPEGGIGGGMSGF